MGSAPGNEEDKVRAKRATAAGRQDPAKENVSRRRHSRRWADAANLLLLEDCWSSISEGAGERLFVCAFESEGKGRAASNKTRAVYAEHHF